MQLFAVTEFSNKDNDNVKWYLLILYYAYYFAAQLMTSKQLPIPTHRLLEDFLKVTLQRKISVFSACTDKPHFLKMH